MIRSVCTVCCVAVVVLAFVATKTARGEEYAATVEPDLRAAVEADWAAQETRAGRQPYGVDALGEALAGSAVFESALAAMPGVADLRAEHAALERLRRRMDDVERMDEPARRELYHQLRWLGRGMAMKNPLLAGRPVAFLKRRRFICQMLHEYIGYYYNYADLAGGGVFVLEEPGRSLKTRDLLAGQLPRGAYATLALVARAAIPCTSPMPRSARSTGRTPRGIDWTMLPSADQVPAELNYYGPNRSAFHLFADRTPTAKPAAIDLGPRRRLRSLPAARRRAGVHVLAARRLLPLRQSVRADSDPYAAPPRSGQRRRRDAFVARDQRVASFGPGRRTDRLLPLGLRRSLGGPIPRPVDQQPRRLESQDPLWQLHDEHQRVFQPRAIPGTNRIVFVAGAHHANVGGSLVAARSGPRRSRCDLGRGPFRVARRG